MIETPAGATKVLVVDDEPSITDLVSMALRYEQFDVRVAGNGREALDTVEEFAPDLAVLDIMMPGIDGFEVARRLRNQGARLPILFLTARDATEDKIRGLTLGGDDYMTKPFSVEELVARIRAILRRVQPAAASPGRLAFADLETGRGHARGLARRDARSSSRPPSSSSSATCSSTRAACSARTRSSTTCGTTTSAATPTSSRPT